MSRVRLKRETCVKIRASRFATLLLGARRDHSATKGESRIDISADNEGRLSGYFYLIDEASRDSRLAALASRRYILKFTFEYESSKYIFKY